jgi:uncharacterized membrane protein YfhO
VDGELVEVRRVDLLFRAVAIDEGTHQVVLTFRPASLRTGIVFSLVGLAVLVAATFALYKARHNAIMSLLLGYLLDE